MSGNPSSQDMKGEVIVPGIRFNIWKAYYFMGSTYPLLCLGYWYCSEIVFVKDKGGKSWRALHAEYNEFGFLSDILEMSLVTKEN